MPTRTDSAPARPTGPAALAALAVVLLAAVALALAATLGGAEDATGERARTEGAGAAAVDRAGGAAAIDAAQERRGSADAGADASPEDAPDPAPGGLITGVLARPGWARAATTRIEVAGLDGAGGGVVRAVRVDPGEERFEVNGLPGGRYALRARCELGPRRAYAELRPVVVPRGGAREGLVLRLGEFVLEGAVATLDGAPLADLPVDVLWWPAPRPAFARVDGRSTRERIAARIESGEARIAALERTRRYLGILGRAGGGGARAALEARIAAVDASAEEIRSDLREARAMARSLPLAKRREPAAPGGDARASGEVLLRTHTDGAGRFLVWLPAPGDGMAIAPREGVAATERTRWLLRGSSVFTVTSEAPRAVCDLRLPRTGALSVGLTSPPRAEGAPVRVRAHPSDGGPAMVLAATGSAGPFVADGLLPGRHVVRVRGGREGSAGACARAVVAVRAGAETRIDLALDRPSSLAGVVVGADGAPLEGAEVAARDADAPAVERSATTDADGAFLVRGLAPGPYDLCLEGLTPDRSARVEIPPGGGRADAGTLAAPPPRRRVRFDDPAHGAQ